MSTDTQQGYTILEVMIFLAVSASVLFIALTSLSGRQQQVQFTQALRDFDSKVQDVLNDVSSGFFNNNGNLVCSVAGNDPPTSEVPGSLANADEQGESNDCIFVGKAIQFRVSESGQTDNNSALIHTMAGRRFSQSGSIATNIVESQPVAIGDPENMPLEWGLQVTKVIDETLDIDRSGVAFYSSFGSRVGTTEVSNSQQVQISLMEGESPGLTPDIFRNNISTANVSNYDPSREVVICLANAENTEAASLRLTLDGSARTQLQIDDYDTRCEV